MEIRKMLALMLGIACTIVHGANTWYSSKERDVSTMANGDAALADLSILITQGGCLQGPHPKGRCPFHFSSCLSVYTQYVRCHRAGAILFKHHDRVQGPMQSALHELSTSSNNPMKSCY